MQRHRFEVTSYAHSKRKFVPNLTQLFWPLVSQLALSMHVMYFSPALFCRVVNTNVPLPVLLCRVVDIVSFSFRRPCPEAEAEAASRCHKNTPTPSADSSVRSRLSLVWFALAARRYVIHVTRAAEELAQDGAQTGLHIVQHDLAHVGVVFGGVGLEPLFGQFEDLGEE